MVTMYLCYLTWPAGEALVLGVSLRVSTEEACGFVDCAGWTLTQGGRDGLHLLELGHALFQPGTSEFQLFKLLVYWLILSGLSPQTQSHSLGVSGPEGFGHRWSLGIPESPTVTWPVRDSSPLSPCEVAPLTSHLSFFYLPSIIYYPSYLSIMSYLCLYIMYISTMYHITYACSICRYQGLRLPIYVSVIRLCILSVLPKEPSHGA